jgi:hypothetical protein
MPQLSLNFIDIPVPQNSLWEKLNQSQRQLLVETLAQLMLKTATTAPPSQKETAND